MKLASITLVSSNIAKAKEVERILKIPIKTVNIDIPEIQSMDIEEVARHKLDVAFNKVKKPVLVDDVSFEVDIWEGFPGPFIKWMLKGKNDPSLILRMMRSENNRSANARLAVGFHDGEKSHIFMGEVEGTIAKEIRGDNGFGWDKVFIPDGYSQTFAEMEPSLKDSISHRGKALKKLSDFIKANYEL